MSFIDKALERAKVLHQKKEKSRFPLAAEAQIPGATPFGAQKFDFPLSSEEMKSPITRTIPVDLEYLRQHRLILGEDGDLVAEEYKLLRTHILQRTRVKGQNTIMVTGPQMGEGKTLTAINLAISISHEVENSVLLVDADLRMPTIHRYFGLPTGPGLVDHITHGVPISELLVHPQGFPKLVLLPSGKPAAHAAEITGSPAMADLVLELKTLYSNRYVLFDLPPLLVFADALAFAPLIDNIILVVEAGKTPRREINRSLAMLKGFPLLGFVLNKAEAITTSSYYHKMLQKNQKSIFSLK